MPTHQTQPTVRCPGCNRPKPKSSVGLYICDHCGAQFDDDPDEGGSHFADPSRRIELEDERRMRARRGTRR